MQPTSTGSPPRRGDIWLAELDKLRPVVIMHRNFAGRRLKAVLAAPLTSTIRDVPTAVALGPEDGLDRRCIASLDNLTLVPVDRWPSRSRACQLSAWGSSAKP